jgi:superfamily II DNA or RNA helicase
MASQPTANGQSAYRRREWKRFIKGPDQDLLEGLYVPMLSGAVRYDRCCAYFSSSVLAAAARGFGRLIERLESAGGQIARPAIRLVVNEELSAEDVRALTETGDLAALEALLNSRFKKPRDLLEKRRLEMLGWLVKKGWLQVRVGVMRSGGGIVHSKFGVAVDPAGDAIVFNGSGNESARGLVANYERLEVSTSWEDPSRYAEYGGEFEQLWQDRHPTVHTVTLPEALRLKLIKLAPAEAPIQEPSNAAARQEAAMVWQFLLEAPYFADGGTTCDATAPVDLWPHQRRVVEETAGAWPAGWLLCDEVGMGKTIEAILILRRLLAGRGVRRALILLPAGLLKQWQTELREKGGLLLPRLEVINQLVWPDGRTQKVDGLAAALEQDLLLMSRETARTEANLEILLQAEAWDLVLLDEAHAARRKKQEEGEFNAGTLLLNLLRQLQLRRKARSILLLSATPMQTHPWEPWDLLAVLGEGGAWLSEFAEVRNFYELAPAVKDGSADFRKARKAAALIASDADFPAPPRKAPGPLEASQLGDLLCFVPSSERSEWADWLRHGSPLGRRMHRNTRGALRRYYERGILPHPPPQRDVEDKYFDFAGRDERDVYDAVTRYIDRRFAELEQEKPGKGFVMTVYRRRASSSPLALERSLKRRREALVRVSRSQAFDANLPEYDVPEALDPDELPEGETASRVSAALPQSPATARAEQAEVEEVLRKLGELGARDSKRDFFFGELRRITEDGRPVLVFSEYTDTVEYLRDALAPLYGAALACYSGAGGLLRDGEQWKPVEKGEITAALQDGRLQVLLCTDAASEGLNLQAAAGLINYDLPWNPSRVEQRIGRIDRIGQKYDTVRVVNLFLENSVDDQVYRALRRRCGLFEHFVGTMQPVLARARRMLRGEEPVDAGALEQAARAAELDPLAGETYMESLALPPSALPPAYTREDLYQALRLVEPGLGVRVQFDPKSATCTVSGGKFPKSRFGARADALEADAGILPLTPFEPRLRELHSALARPGECLPLVLGACQDGAFRCSVAYWIDGRNAVPVRTLRELTYRLKQWDGTTPPPAQWAEAEGSAREEGRAVVESLKSNAARREAAALERQVAAARLRLQKELGRYLVCLGESTTNLNAAFHRQITRDTAGSGRLKRCHERLGGYPEWPEDLRAELDEFISGLPENRRTARLLGSELDAALEDPRWVAACRKAGEV